MKLKLKDAQLAGIYGLPAQDTDTDSILSTYAARGWKDADTMAHIDAAIQAGAFAREAIKQAPMKAGDMEGKEK